jgi:hypothetical protein
VSLARVVALLAAIALIGCGSGGGKAPTAHRSPLDGVRAHDRADGPITNADLLIPTGSGALAVMASSNGLTLRDRPKGKVVAHLRPKTDWGSPTVVWAVHRKGPWLGVIATALRNNRIAWIDVRHDQPRMWRERLSLEADLSQRTLVLKRGSRVIRRMTVGIGDPSTPTPTGRFVVTDKLIPDRSVSYYGCCLLALSGHQPVLRPGWAGGDRIAIHGGAVGGAASAGCLHASDKDLKALMKLIPVGTPVVIRA